MHKINGQERTEIDEVGEIASIPRLADLVGAACDVRLAKSGLPIGQRYGKQAVNYHCKAKKKEAE